MDVYHVKQTAIPRLLEIAVLGPSKKFECEDLRIRSILDFLGVQFYESCYYDFHAAKTTTAFRHMAFNPHVEYWHQDGGTWHYAIMMIACDVTRSNLGTEFINLWKEHPDYDAIVTQSDLIDTFIHVQGEPWHVYLCKPLVHRSPAYYGDTFTRTLTRYYIKDSHHQTAIKHAFPKKD